ncbi:MAG: hypothetical protein MR817_02385 [Lachnospiraceae bacterium]|nr:hypothetical protein [Lachnospiraceae bacterium]
MAIKNMAASVLTRLKNQSKEEGIPFQMVLQLFAQEEFRYIRKYQNVLTA